MLAPAVGGHQAVVGCTGDTVAAHPMLCASGSLGRSPGASHSMLWRRSSTRKASPQREVASGTPRRSGMLCGACQSTLNWRGWRRLAPDLRRPPCLRTPPGAQRRGPRRTASCARPGDRLKVGSAASGVPSPAPAGAQRRWCRARSGARRCTAPWGDGRFRRALLGDHRQAPHLSQSNDEGSGRGPGGAPGQCAP